MVDGIDLHGRANIVALGISTEGEKLALGLWDGSSENATVAGRCWRIWSTAASTSSKACCS